MLKKLLKTSFQNKKTLILVLILAIAAFLRLYRIEDYMTFLGDEGRDVLVVYNILHGRLTFLGPTASVGGFFLGPIYYYFMTPFLFLFSYSPVGPAIMVALFGIATVFLVFLVGEKFFNAKAGLIAAALYAISPITIAYSRSSWNPNLMPFFSIAMLFVLYKATDKNNLRLFALCGLLLGIAVQLHYLAVFLGAIIFIYIFITSAFNFEKKQILKQIIGVLKKYICVFFGFIIGFSPFLVFEIRHGFSNLRSIINFIIHSGDTGGSGNFYKIVEDVFFRLFGRLVTKFPPPEQVSLEPYLNIAVWHFLTLSLAVLSVIFLFIRFYKSIRQDKKNLNKYLLLIIWFFFGILFFGFYKKSIYDYYLGLLFPLPFLLVGNIFSFSLGGNKFLKIFSAICLTSLFWINFGGIPFRSEPNRQLAQVEEISRFIFQKTEKKPFNFALITGGNSDHAYRYFFRLWKHDPTVIQNIENDPKRTTVMDQLLVVCEIECEPLGNSLWEVAGFGRAEITDKWDVSVVHVYKLIHYKGS